MTLPSASIPIIDLSGPQHEVAKQLVDAAADHGFIYIKNMGHDMPAASVNEAFDLSRKLFEAPIEQKEACSIQTNNRGWTSMHAEKLDPQNQKVGDFKEAFNFGEFIDNKAQQPIPPAIADDEARVSAFASLCRALCLKILSLLGQGLGVRPNLHVNEFFSSAHFRSPSGSGTILRFLRYPPPSITPHSRDDIRAGAHSDYGSITLLFRLQGQAGLEILEKGGVWVPVPVLPPGTENDPSPPILINIGDLLAYWTNGLFRSTVHRVVFPRNGENDSNRRGEWETGSEPRYSIAFFCHPMDDALLDPVPSKRVTEFAKEDAAAGNPYAERKVLTAGEHLLMRLKESYGTLYEAEEPKRTARYG